MPISPAFIHLRLHSEYSVSDSIIRIKDAISSAAADHMPALALTDLSNVFGLVKFYQGLEPRISTNYILNNGHAIKAAFTRTKQYQHLIHSRCVRSLNANYQVQAPYLLPKTRYTLDLKTNRDLRGDDLTSA